MTCAPSYSPMPPSHACRRQDLRYLRDEVGAATTDEDFATSKADTLRLRLDRQVRSVQPLSL